MSVHLEKELLIKFAFFCSFRFRTKLPLNGNESSAVIADDYDGGRIPRDKANVHLKWVVDDKFWDVSCLTSHRRVMH